MYLFQIQITLFTPMGAIESAESGIYSEIEKCKEEKQPNI